MSRRNKAAFAGRVALAIAALGFGLGAYAFGMYLKLEAAGPKLPDFMAWSGLTSLPWFWRPFVDPPPPLSPR